MFQLLCQPENNEIIQQHCVLHNVWVAGVFFKDICNFILIDLRKSIILKHNLLQKRMNIWHSFLHTWTLPHCQITWIYKHKYSLQDTLNEWIKESFLVKKIYTVYQLYGIVEKFYCNRIECVYLTLWEQSSYQVQNIYEPFNWFIKWSWPFFSQSTKIIV